MTSRSDGSLRLSCETPELTAQEKAAFMELQGLNLNAMFEPLDFQTSEVMKVDREAGQTSPSQRLRNRMYRYHKEKKIEEDFDLWYVKQMDKIGQKYLNEIN